jgi:DNA transformation protein and related proteins
MARRAPLILTVPFPADDDVTPISSIKNLGPATETAFAKAGITSAEELRALGADEAYRRWLQAGLPPHFIGYYVLVMGLQGRPWNDCTGDEKKALRARFDALKSESGPQAKGRSELEAALNFFGVLAPKA